MTEPETREEQVNKVIAEYLTAVEAGQAPDCQVLVRQHPHLAAELTEFFRDRDRFQRFAEGLPANPPGTEGETLPPKDKQVPLSGPVTEGAEGTSVPTETAFTAGRRFADYELLEELGRGGMGVVYKARHQKLQRLVALKMILAGAHAGASELARFRIEAEAIARLQHPHIVQIHEVGEHDGCPFFSLEYCTGGNLAAKLNGTPLPPREGAALVEKLARAIHAAHEKGVVHRDLKPANVLLAEDGSLKITDFGLAKKLDEAGQTATGAIMGTPSYMAPEQAGMAGTGRKSGEIGPAADVYALGAILYECLTGRPPFKAATPLDTVLQVISDEPVPPSRLQSKLPRDLETICLKCLAKEPKKRYADASALAADLHRFQAHEPILARRISLLGRLLKWTRRRPVTAALIAAIIVVATAGLTAVLWQWQRAESAAHREQLQVQQTKAQEILAEERRVAGHQRQVQMQVSNGLRLMEEGDLLNSLLWFAEAVKLETDDRARAQVHRVRLGALLKQCPKLVQAWFPEGGASHAAFSPDGQQVVIGSKSGIARVWNVLTGEPVTPPLVHKFPLTRASFSSDGRRLLTVSGQDKGQGEARVWDLVIGKPLTPPVAHQSPVALAFFSPDGKRIFTSSGAGDESHVWDAQTGQPLGLALNTPKQKYGTVVRLASFSPDSRRLITGDYYYYGDKSVTQIWDLETGKSLLLPVNGGNPSVPPIFTPDGRRVFTVSRKPAEVRLWDATTGEALGKPMKHDNWIWAASLSSDGLRLATASSDQTARVWGATTGEPVTPRLKHGGVVLSVSFSADARFLLTASGDGAQIWDAATGESVGRPMKHEGSVRSAQFSKDGRQVLTIAYLAPTNTTQARLWNASTGDPISPPLGGGALLDPQGQRMLTIGGGGARVWEVPSDGPAAFVLKPVRQASFSPDSSRLLVVNTDGTAKICDGATGQPLGLVLKQRFPVRSALFSPDGLRIATNANLDAKSPGEVQIWDVKTGAPQAPLISHRLEVVALAFSPDSRCVLTAGRDQTAQIFNIEAGREVRLQLKRDDFVYRASFSPDSRRVLTLSSAAAVSPGGGVNAGAPATAQVWDVLTGAPVTPPLKHRSYISKASFNADGSRLLTSGGGEARVWNAATGEPVSPPLKHDAGNVVNAACSPDGLRVITAMVDRPKKAGEAIIWDALTGAPITPALKHRSEVWFVTFSSDGRHVLTGSCDSTARVWDATSGKPITRPMRGESLHIHFASFSPDDRFVLAAGLGSKFARVWDAATGELITPPLKHNAEIVARFSPNAHRILTKTKADEAFVWDFAPDERPAKDLALLVQLLSGRHIDAYGDLVPLEVEALAKAWETLRTKYPAQFGPGTRPTIRKNTKGTLPQ